MTSICFNTTLFQNDLGKRGIKSVSLPGMKLIPVHVYFLRHINLYPLSMIIFVCPSNKVYMYGNETTTMFNSSLFSPQPHEHFGNIAPDPDADFLLFDRVVHVKMNTTVPFGMRGTIIGIHEGATLDYKILLVVVTRLRWQHLKYSCKFLRQYDVSFLFRYIKFCDCLMLLVLS